MNRVRNTAQNERKLATDFGCCRPAHSELPEAPLWGKRQGGWAVWRIMDLIMVPMMANGGQSLYIYLKWQSMLPEWMSVMCTHGNSGSPHRPHVCWEEIRVLIIHLQLSLPLQPGYAFQRRNSRSRMTPNLYQGELRHRRNSHHVCLSFTEV